MAAEVKLYFYVIGLGESADWVLLKNELEVGDLANAIKQKSAPDLDNISPQRLILYSVDLANNAVDLKKLARGEDVKGAERLGDSSRVLSECFKDIKGGRVRVLVQLPNTSNISLSNSLTSNVTSVEPFSKLTVLVGGLFELVMERFEYTSGKTERGDNVSFKLRLYNFYHNTLATRYPEVLRCFLTGAELDSAAVIAAHLFKQEWGGAIRTLFNIPDIDDPRGGLLFYKPIEEAYDRSQLCFHMDENRDFICHILDPKLRTHDFSQYLKSNRSHQTSTNTAESGMSYLKISKAISTLNELGITTFNDLEGRALQFPTLSRPAKRILNFHARKARDYAIKMKWISEEDWDFDDYLSDGGYTTKELAAWREGAL